MIKWDWVFTIVLAGILLVVARRFLPKVFGSNTSSNPGNNMILRPQNASDWVMQRFPNATTI